MASKESSSPRELPHYMDKEPCLEVFTRDQSVEELFVKFESLQHVVHLIFVSPGDFEKGLKYLETEKEFTRETQEEGFEGYLWGGRLVKTPACKIGEMIFLCEGSGGWAKVKF